MLDTEARKISRKVLMSRSSTPMHLYPDEVDHQNNGHRCAGRLPDGACGEAITSCFTNRKGKMFVGNDEYLNQVNYCPYCGAKAGVLVKWEPEEE